MGIVVKGLRAFQRMGTQVYDAAHDGIVKLAHEIMYRLSNITPAWYGDTLAVHEKALGRVFVGPTGFVPEVEQIGVKRVKDTCAEFKFRFVDWKMKSRESRPWLRQMKDEMISSGYAKQVVVNSIADRLGKMFG